MAELPADLLVPLPRHGRIFRAERPVRFADVDRQGCVRLDALARYLQDIAGDDTAEAGLAGAGGWVVRRNLFEVRCAPRLDERVQLTTWSSGAGRRWAERRISVRSTGGAEVEGSSLWVFVDPATVRPVPLDPRFVEVYAEANGGRAVSSRLQHPPAPPVGAEATETRRFPWPLRVTDLDPFAHVNNAASWAVVEEVLADARVTRPFRAEVEHRVAIEPGADVMVTVAEGDDGFHLWATDGSGADAPVLLTARVAALGGPED